ncbi:MAG: hypothetical protein AAGJ81_01475 [Verrucomicrobiota bacterium]
MKAWILCISGFTETIGEHTGTARLWKQLRKLSSPETSVQLFEWDENWRKKAAFIAEHSDPDVRILVCAYSWGAGYGFRKLARHLQHYDIAIETAVLCDPIYRSRTLFLRWLAFVPGLPIRIPTNVREVFYFFQRKDRLLRGHHPKAVSLGTWIRPGVEIDRNHSGIDEHQKYHTLAHGEALRILNQSPREAGQPNLEEG